MIVTPRKWKRRSIAFVAALLGLVTIMPANSLATTRVEFTRIISTDGTTHRACGLSDSKAEVSLAVSPRDPRRLTAAWIQGARDADGADTATNVWTTSRDGGKHWTRPQPVHGITECTGSTQAQNPDDSPELSVDPSVSFGADGTAYLASTNLRSLVLLVCCSHLYVNRSLDGGLHWAAPVLIDEPANTGISDAAFVTADPRFARRAYLVWNHVDPPWIKFASTSDGGATWSGGSIAVPGPRTISPMAVMPDSSLLLTYADALTDNDTQWSVRSSDGGRSWSAPVRIADYTKTTRPTLAAGLDGSAYVAFVDGGGGRVMVARSADGGRTWRAPREVARKAGAQQATIAVRRDGAIGLLWYDKRAADGTIAEVWFAHSRDHGATWSKIHLGGPFDLGTPTTGFDDPPLGGYQGLVATRDGFAAAFVMAKPQAKTGPTDVFFARIRV